MVAPTLVDAPDHVVQALERKLTDPGTSLAAKYRVLFSLRNIRGEAAHRALMTGERGAPSSPRAVAAAARRHPQQQDEPSPNGVWRIERKKLTDPMIPPL